ncbi:MAG: HmuY family protein [Bacteroidetes bacterium]|nr:HmuY family protein [Bacteroidota bacterium]
MKNKPISLLILLAGVSLTGLSACEDDATSSDDNAQAGAVVKTVSNLDADTALTGKFTFFSFKTGEKIPNSDSATTKWDVGFRGTTIILNGGTSGPGLTKVKILSSLFEDVTQAPDSGYVADQMPATYAIPIGSGKGWYTYDSGINLISPIAGKVFVVKTSEDRYAKFEILSYYKDKVITEQRKSRYYFLRYVYQPENTKIFN